MEDATAQPTPPRLSIVVICGLLVGFFTLMGTLAAWPAIAGWLPQETVPVKITDSEARMSGFSGNRGTTASAGFSITTIDENGNRQHISCPKATYNALTKGYGIGYSVKLVRNPFFKTPVAFLRQPESLVKYEKGSVLEKLNANNSPRPSERFPVVAYPVVWFVCGVFLFGIAIFLLIRLPRFSVSRLLSIPVYATCFFGGIALGIVMT